MIGAWLAIYDPDPKKASQPIWQFQYNPSSLKFRTSAEYAEQKTLSGDVPEQQFFTTSGTTLQISQIYLDSYCLGKSLQPLLDGIEALLMAKVDKQQYSPPVLTFIFGTRRFGPCVLTECEWTETAWLSGAPAKAEMSLSFKEVPVDRKTADKAIAPKDSKDGAPRIKLTERQRKEGSDKAIANLIAPATLAKLSASVQGTIKSKAYKVSTDENTGDVILYDAKGNKLGAIGRYDGTKLDTSTQVFTVMNPVPKGRGL